MPSPGLTLPSWSAPFGVSSTIWVGQTRIYQQFKKLVDLGLGAQVVAGVGVLLAADADPNEIAVQGESILVVIIVADVEDPVAAHAVAFGGQRLSFIRRTVHHQVHHLLATDHSNLIQVPRGGETPPAGFGLLGRLAVMHGQRETL